MHNQLIPIWLFSLIALFMLFGSLHADVQVSAQAENETLYEGMPTKILVTVTHASSQSIDPKSFKIGRTPYPAVQIDEKTMTAAGDLKLTMFHIDLGVQDKGPHLLSPIEVKVDGKTYRSIASTYEISAPSPSNNGVNNSKNNAPQPSNASSSSTSSQPPPNTPSGMATPVLKFEAFVEGPTTIFPGQKTLVGYRYTYNTSIDTISEQTPLLNAEGLTKVGDKIVQEDQKDGSNVLKIYQIVKGEKPGKFTYGPSVLEGITASKQKLSAKAEAVTIDVVSYPENSKPTSFNGALGDFDWKVNLESSPNVHVGDELSLLITATGIGDWDSVNLTELCCQPGMSGFFRFDDLPNAGVVQGDSKQFKIKLRPLMASITEIPSFQFSSFDPDKRTYRTVDSPAIPIQVQADAKSPPTPTKNDDTTAQPQDDWKHEFNTPKPLKISSSPKLVTADLHNLLFGDWWSFVIIPLGIGLLIFLSNCKTRFMQYRQQEDAIRSEDIYKEAMGMGEDSPDFYPKLKQAFLLRLYEDGEINSAELDPAKLNVNGLQGKVRDLFAEFDKQRYSGKSTNKNTELSKQAADLFEELRG